MKKDKCASCGKQGELNVESFHSYFTDCNYRIMVCDDCLDESGPTLEVAPTHCPACGKKLGEHDLDYQDDVDGWDYEAAAAMGVDLDTDEWEERFNYVYDLMDCPRCGFTASHGSKWYWNEESGCYDLPQPKSGLIPPDQERRLAKEAGQLDMFDGQ